MDYRGLRIAKILLFRLFWVQFAFLVLAWVLYTLGKDTFYPWVLALSGVQIGSEDMAQWVFMFIGLGKFMLYYFYLVPAMAICWTLRQLDKKPL